MPWRKCGFDSRWALVYGVIQDVGKPGNPPVSGTGKRGFKSHRPDLLIAVSCVGTGGRLLTALTQVRFLPPQFQIQRKGKPTVDGSRLENGRAMNRLEGSTPSPSAFVVVPLAERQRRQPSKLGRRVQLPQGTLRESDRGSASGRLPGFEPGDEGSNPSPRTWSDKRCHDD